MKSLSTVLVILVGICIVDTLGKVEILSDADFDRHVNAQSKENWFVLFWIPRCIHCQYFKPQWERIEPELADVNTRIATVNW